MIRTLKDTKKSSRIENYLTILDLIRITGSRQLTAREVFDSSNLGYTRTVLWLKYLRKAIDQKRPYANGYRYSTRLNQENHRHIFVYWYEN